MQQIPGIHITTWIHNAHPIKSLETCSDKNGFPQTKPSYRHTSTLCLHLGLVSALPYTMETAMAFRAASLSLHPGDREQNPTPALQVQTFFTQL